MKLKELYETNKDFREYVDKYAKSQNITVDEAVKHEMVRQYAKYKMEE